MLARFMARYPGVTLHLEATNRRVDVVGEGIDVAIRVRPRPIVWTCSKVTGQVILTLPRGSARSVSTACCAASASISLHLEATNRRVDVVGEGIDVAIRVRPRPIEDSDLAHPPGGWSPQDAK
jgi:DNA-binding transcriptional LysR family regulator